MEIEKVKSLKVLNASAGSGKTYNLVREYLLLLLGDQFHPSRFSKILAMTFTNKAAIEMKDRIIAKLDEVAYHSDNQKTKEYIDDLSSELGCTSEEIQRRALLSLKAILHQYEDFHIMTIDKFNLRLIRSFSRDLDLPGEFEVILDESEVSERVVDLLMSQIGNKDLELLTDLMISYAKENIDEGERWDFRNQLIQFSSILSKEKNFPLVQKLMGMDFSNQARRTLKNEIDQIEEDFFAQCREVHAFYLALGIPEELYPGKSKTTKHLDKLASLERIPHEIFTVAYMTDLEKPVPTGRQFPDEMKDLIRELHKKHKTAMPLVEVKRLFLRNFYNMALLQYIARTMDAVKKEDQQIRISEFNALISKLVQEEKAAFIYERLGTRYKNFLLDEFQDTSRLQWLNLVPLVHESLSQRDLNLIVGDPKQSIYRFKNGVAEQFVSLPGIFNPENDSYIKELSDYFEDAGEVLPLEGNYRSGRIIVEFNNSFFLDLRESLPDSTQTFYNAIEQTPCSDKPGYVKIVSNESDPDFDSQFEFILNAIQETLSEGYLPGEICILSDTNQRANDWAIELTHQNYRVVSADSLLVQSEPKVKLILSYLKRRLNPGSITEQKKFADLFFRIQNVSSPYENYKNYISSLKNKDGKTIMVFDENRFLSDNFQSREVFFKKYDTLYELVQSFYKAMGWVELRNPYLHHFADFVFEFEQKKGPDLRGLIEQYQKVKGKLAIQLPESKESINIMTIHKAKGLEFPVVIIPYLNFDTQIHWKNNFLVEIDDVIVYTGLTKSSPIPGIRDLNKGENEQILTDKVNMCYVGFTRPEERLYVLNQAKGDKFGKRAHETFKKQVHTLSEDGSILIELGEKVTKEMNEEEYTQEPFFIPSIENDVLWFPEISLRRSLTELKDSVQSNVILTGNQFHDAVSRIKKSEDIQPVLREMILNGELEQREYNRIEQMLLELFKCEEYVSLLASSDEDLSEQSMIVDRETIRRPDKLLINKTQATVVDFKTGIQKDSDLQQVLSYASSLEKMGYSSVSGYLYYAQSGTLHKVC
ncbi:MAG: hypothetical protein RIT43_1864 [Bacteroidota bacterium]